MTNKYLIFGTKPSRDVIRFLDIDLQANDLELVRVNDEYVSNNHMLACFTGHAILIADMGSTNGTWIIVNRPGFQTFPTRVSMTGRFTLLVKNQAVKIGHTIIPYGTMKLSQLTFDS